MLLHCVQVLQALIRNLARAIAGALTIAHWRVVALVVAVLWLGAIVCGLAFNFALMLRLF